MVPALLVTLGYIFLFRRFGVSPGYFRLIIAMAVFFGLIWWLGRKTAGRADSSQQ
jgi:ABC-type spermidine/putrescine transport system permease subunit II